MMIEGREGNMEISKTDAYAVADIGAPILSWLRKNHLSLDLSLLTALQCYMGNMPYKLL